MHRIYINLNENLNSFLNKPSPESFKEIPPLMDKARILMGEVLHYQNCFRSNGLIELTISLYEHLRPKLDDEHPEKHQDFMSSGHSVIYLMALTLRVLDNATNNNRKSLHVFIDKMDIYRLGQLMNLEKCTEIPERVLWIMYNGVLTKTLKMTPDLLRMIQLATYKHHTTDPGFLLLTKMQFNGMYIRNFVKFDPPIRCFLLTFTLELFRNRLLEFETTLLLDIAVVADELVSPNNYENSLSEPFMVYAERFFNLLCCIFTSEFFYQRNDEMAPFVFKCAPYLEYLMEHGKDLLDKKLFKDLLYQILRFMSLYDFPVDATSKIEPSELLHLSSILDTLTVDTEYSFVNDWALFALRKLAVVSPIFKDLFEAHRLRRYPKYFGSLIKKET